MNVWGEHVQFRLELSSKIFHIGEWRHHGRQDFLTESRSVWLTWNVIWAVKMILSFSKRPLVVYTYTEKVMQSIKLRTRCLISSAGSARSMAFSNTTLNAWQQIKDYFINSTRQQCFSIELVITLMKTCCKVTLIYKRMLSTYHIIPLYFWSVCMANPTFIQLKHPVVIKLSVENCDPPWERTGTWGESCWGHWGWSTTGRLGQQLVCTAHELR